VLISLEDSHFDHDSAALNENGKTILNFNAKILKDDPSMKIRIAGYASASGTKEYNQKLSERRATSVRNYLIKEGGIAPSRLTTVGYGETRPAEYEPVPSDIYSEAAKANQRVLFEVIVK
jgi:OOP family OmpA-OmpF porin